ncbi:MAG: DUF4838 domain-containing protein [Planctomycetota bacterium]
MISAIGWLLIGWTLPAQDPVLIAKDGVSDYRIVLAESAPPADRTAAEELSRCLFEITGARLSIVSEGTDPHPHEILVGESTRLPHERWQRLLEVGADGYALETIDERLVLVGPPPRGTLYAVIGYLTDHLGARWFTPELEVLPKRPTLPLPGLHERVTPTFEYREPYLFEAFDPAWQPRMRIHGRGQALGPERGGRLRFGEGWFAHTFTRLVPPDEYFERHPEYFSLVGGQRLKEHGQLCCTNEDVIALCTARILKAIAAEPEATVFSVSQNDWANDCECKRCSELVDREGSRMAPVLHLVNRIAETVANEHPGKLIETLAYQWSRRPPKSLRPLPNVVVRLCTIECSFGAPLEASTDPADIAFRDDLVAWARICDRLWIWNYNTSFMHFLLPFPNHHVRAANLRFFARHGVRGVFEQDCYNTAASELAPLDAYVASRLLWNPWLDLETLQRELLDAWFHDAASPIFEYLELLATRADGHHIGIWSGPHADYLGDDFLEQANALWQSAEEATRADPAALARVQVARLSVDYAILERGRTGAGLPFSRDDRAGRLSPHPLPAERLEPFARSLAASGLTRLNEWNVLDRDAYLGELRAFYRARDLERHPCAEGEMPDMQPGVLVACYPLAEIERTLPDLSQRRPAWVRTTPTIGLEARDRDDGFALRFRGQLEIERDGIHRFVLRCNDGARLRIGGRSIVDYDGIHPTADRIGFAHLAAGWHDIELDYLENRGSEALSLRVDGPSGSSGLLKLRCPPPGD